MKNYTSEVPVEKTVARIEEALVRSGASNIMKEYVAGRVSGISFALSNPNGGKVIIRLPANIEAVFEVLRKQVKRHNHQTQQRLHEQSKRTAWKLMQDLVEVQLSLVEMRQAEALEVFMPYVWNGQRSFYAHVKEAGFTALPAPLPSLQVQRSNDSD